MLMVRMMMLLMMIDDDVDDDDDDDNDNDNDNAISVHTSQVTLVLGSQRSSTTPHVKTTWCSWSASKYLASGKSA